VEGPAIRIDAERRGLLRVERAEAAVRAPGLAELHALAHELDDVHAFLDEVEITGHDYHGIAAAFPARARVSSAG
jgi:hypothetical protein